MKIPQLWVKNHSCVKIIDAFSITHKFDTREIVIILAEKFEIWDQVYVLEFNNETPLTTHKNEEDKDERIREKERKQNSTKVSQFGNV